MLKRLRAELAKRYAPNTVAVTDAVRLDDYAGRYEVTLDLPFRGGRGAVLRRDMYYDSAWKPALEGADLPDRFVFHSLLHFCASNLLAKGAPITAVAGHLGDTIETVSRVYAYWLRDDREIPAELLDQVFAEPVASSPRHAASGEAP